MVQNIDPRTVVWVANRDNPLQNNSTNDGFLKISDNGNIVLFNSSLDSNNNLVWSSNQTTVTNNQVVLQLLDNGNLVLVLVMLTFMMTEVVVLCGLVNLLI
jgi:hypothetical protein